MKLLVAIAALVAHATAQTTFLDSPILLWTGTVPPVREGNECVLAPLNPLLLCSSTEGDVKALFTNSASDSTRDAWTYSDANMLSCTSGITFSSTGSSFIYGTTDSDGISPIW